MSVPNEVSTEATDCVSHFLHFWILSACLLQQAFSGILKLFYHPIKVNSIKMMKWKINVISNRSVNYWQVLSPINRSSFG